jgi:alpha-galactosidase/6-phospho-beta-glucosidase family protein
VEQQELIEKIKRLPPDRVAEVEAFVDSLTPEPGLDQTALHQAISEYAIQHMGTEADLDPDLEAAATEQLLDSDKN